MIWKSLKREKNPGYRPEKVYSDTPSESKPAKKSTPDSFIENHITTKKIKNNHPYASNEDIQAFYNEEIKGRGDGSKEAAEKIFSNYGNTGRYFDQWYKRNRNKKWYAEEMKKKYGKDSAPRELTGDCKIKVRK